MPQINFTSQQLKTLIIFLNRVQLQGNEAAAFIEILLVLRKQVESVLPQNEPTKKDDSKKPSQ